MTSSTHSPLWAELKRLAVALGLTLLVGAVALWGGRIGTARAAGGSCTTPAMGKMQGWMFFPQSLQVNFRDTGSGSESLTFPSSVASVDSTWGGLDNPDALLWYGKHVPGSNTQLGMIFGCNQTYTSDLIATMNADHFAPSMVGGVNPPSITTVTSQPTQTQTTTPTKTKTTTTQTTSASTSPPKSQTSTGTVGPQPQYPPVVTDPPPSWVTQRIQRMIHHDEQIVALGGSSHKQGKPATPQRGSPLPYVAAA